MLNSPTKRNKTIQAFILILLAWLLISAANEVYQPGYESGQWIGSLSTKWVIINIGFGCLFIATFVTAYYEIFYPTRLAVFLQKILIIRNRLGWSRWVLLTGVLLVYLWFILYSNWAVIFTGLYLKIVLFLVTVYIAAWLLTDSKENRINILPWTSSIILVGGIVSILNWFTGVSDYPFSLYWSEGNRLWDYSLLFIPDMYDYPVGELTDTLSYPAGRLLPFGIPYLFPSASITFLRFWNSLLFVLPAIVLGWIAIRQSKFNLGVKAIFSLWVYLFLNQGPIWTSLILIATLVLLVRKSKMVVAIPMLIFAGYFAAMSRPTWVFAPSIWIVMMMFSEPFVDKRKLITTDWVRTIALGGAGIFGSIILPRYLKIFPPVIRPWSVAANPDGSIVGDFWEQTVNLLTHQSLLWYRLLPNPTYPIGIVLGIMLASLPLIVLLQSALKTKSEKLNLWQSLIVVGALGAFLFVGLVASVKVGGGTNLHNLDMYLIGVFIFAAMIFGTYTISKFEKLITSSNRFSLLIFMVVTVPAILPILGSSPKVSIEDLLVSISQDDQSVSSSLVSINQFVTCADQYGEILFMDQRQLLTFGYVPQTPFVLAYEKKVVMDEALANNQLYFDVFYSDLDAGRFSLIVADRQFAKYKNISQSLAAENNAWVEWVSIPLMQRYDSVKEFKQVGVELFMPKGRTYQCP